MKVSIVINLDTRQQNNTFGGANLLGCVNEDFLTHGVLNKVTFFQGFEREVIVYIDKHNPVSTTILDQLLPFSDTLVVREHTDEHLFNDNNYVRALSLATGDIVCHFDSDTAAFTSCRMAVQEYVDLLETYSVVSYPHWFSPAPDVNDNYDYWWASTRFFMCKREFLDIAEIKKCLADNDYLYSKYPASIRNPWTEHILGLMAKYNGKGVFYPPLDADKLLIFSWGSYQTGLLEKLNGMSYDEVVEWQKRNPMHFPNDIYA